MDYDGWSYSCPIDIDPTIEVPCTLWVGAGCFPELFPTQICPSGESTILDSSKASRSTDRAIVGGGGEHLLACVRKMLGGTFLIIGDCTSES